MYLLEEEHPCTGILVKRNSNMQVSLNEYVDYLWMLLEVEYSVYLLEEEHPCTGILIKRNTNTRVSLNEYVGYMWMLSGVK